MCSQKSDPWFLIACSLIQNLYRIRLKLMVLMCFRINSLDMRWPLTWLLLACVGSHVLAQEIVQVLDYGTTDSDCSGAYAVNTQYHLLQGQSCHAFKETFASGNTSLVMTCSATGFATVKIYAYDGSGDECTGTPLMSATSTFAQVAERFFYSKSAGFGHSPPPAPPPL